MKWQLNINNRAAIAIKNRTKKIEIRANKDKAKHDYSKMKSGDIIEFSNEDNNIFYVKITGVNYYKTLEDLLMLEGTKYTTSSTNDYKEAINNIYKINGYKAAINKNGVYAIHIDYLYSKDTIWEELYEIAKNVIKEREISNMISAGSVGAAILTKNHNIYTGVCIDTASSLGMCAERNAIANMITNYENEIQKLVCIDTKGQTCYPCGACREFLMQLSKKSKDIEILKSIDTKETITLKELIPDWWGTDRI